MSPRSELPRHAPVFLLTLWLIYSTLDLAEGWIGNYPYDIPYPVTF